MIVKLPLIVPDTAVKLPNLTSAQPELLIEPVVAPVSVVIIASNAVSASFQTNAAFTEPYGAVAYKLRFINIPISYVGVPAYPLLKTTNGSLMYVFTEFNCV